MNSIGDRVVAICNSDKTKIYIFGCGIYEGNSIPEEAVGFLAKLAREAGITNPRIKLNSGKIVYGCECWFGPVEIISKDTSGREVVVIDIDKYREENK